MEQVMLDMQEDERQEQQDLLPSLADSAQQGASPDLEQTI
jgi:hypothetical protein